MNWIKRLFIKIILAIPVPQEPKESQESKALRIVREAAAVAEQRKRQEYDDFLRKRGEEIRLQQGLDELYKTDQQKYREAKKALIEAGYSYLR